MSGGRPTAALIVGASGGIGAALARLWRNEARYDALIGACRDPDKAVADCTHVLAVDVRDAASVGSFGDCVRAVLGDHQLETVCLCLGVLHGDGIQPERRFSELSAEAYRYVMEINALGPLMLAQQLVPLLPRQARSRLLAISARVGSIGDNRLGGWISYRASKAALNQGMQTLAVELRRTHPNCVVTLYHPGTVATALSAPFQRNVRADRLFSPAFAAQRLSQVLHARNTTDEALFVDWSGTPVAF